MHITYDDTQIPKTATLILHIHENKQKNKVIHTIINIYRRPHHDPDFITNLQSAKDTITAKHPTTDITIQGDININLYDLTPSSPFTHFLLENNLHTTITTPTRYDPVHNTATLIDPTLTTITETSITAGTISPPLSDHLQTYTIFHKPIPRQTRNSQKTLSQHRYQKHKDDILPLIQAAITDTQETCSPTTTTAQHFTNIQQALHTIITAHEKTPRPRRKPWCNSKYSRMIKKQHKLHERRIQDPTPQNIKAHTQYRNRLNKQIKAEKKRTITEKIQNSKHDPKQQAKLLKSILPSRKQDRTSPTTIVYEGKTYTDPTDIANALNDHYITIGHKTSQTIPHQAVDSITQEPDRHTHPPFELRHITLDETTKTMKDINPNKASDIYKIKPAIIKDLTPFLAPILTKLFNQAIDEHSYPDPLKFTKVIEIYKKKDKTFPANYRPISLLPIIAKLLDTLINTQIMTHLTKYNIISPTQYTFRPNSNTTLALQTVLNKLHKHKSNKHPTLAIYVDLSKAYDTISHSKLLHKLRHDFNFTPHTVDFFRSYLTNRTQQTHTQHAQSRTKIITHGIPQGSTLSTTFFLLYINDIIKTVTKSTVYTYADDTTLIITSKNITDLQQLAQTELTNLIQYFHSNNLVPNPTKTNYTIFHPPNQHLHPYIQLNIDDTILKQNRKAPLLGMIIQHDMKHQQTINNIIKKLQPTIQTFRYANKYLPTQTMKQLYYSLIYPHLIQNISIWGTHDNRKTYIQPLIRTQKKILRLIKHLPPRSHTQPIMTELKILNITNLYIHRTCTEMHPFIHPPTQLNRPEHNHNYIWTSQIHEYPTRYSQQKHLYIPNTTHHNTTQPHPHMEHLTKQASNIWNTLPLTTHKPELQRN